MRTARATQTLMRQRDEKDAARLRARGWIVVRKAEPDHVYREYNDAGGTCQAPGCDLAWGEHFDR